MAKLTCSQMRYVFIMKISNLLYKTFQPNRSANIRQQVEPLFPLDPPKRQTAPKNWHRKPYRKWRFASTPDGLTDHASCVGGRGAGIGVGLVKLRPATGTIFLRQPREQIERRVLSRSCARGWRWVAQKGMRSTFAGRNGRGGGGTAVAGWCCAAAARAALWPHARQRDDSLAFSDRRRHHLVRFARIKEIWIKFSTLLVAYTSGKTFCRVVPLDDVLERNSRRFVGWCWLSVN